MGLSRQNLSISNQSPPLSQTYVLVPATEILNVNKTNPQTTISRSQPPKTALIAAGILTTLGTGSYFFYKHYNAKTQPINSSHFQTMTGLFFITFFTGIAALAYKTKLGTVRYSPSQINPKNKLVWDKPSKIDTLDDLSKMIEHLNDIQVPLDATQKKHLQSYTSLLINKLRKLNTENKVEANFYVKIREVIEIMLYLDNSSAIKIAQDCLSIQSKNEMIEETRTSILKSILQSDLGIAFVIDYIEKTDKSNHQDIVDEGIEYFFHQGSIEQQLEFLKECAKLNSQKHLEIQKVVVNTFFHLYCCYDKSIDELSLKEALNAFLEAKNDQMVRLFLLACEHSYPNLYNDMYTLAQNNMKNNPESLKILKGLNPPKQNKIRDSLEASKTNGGPKAQDIKHIRF